MEFREASDTESGCKQLPYFVIVVTPRTLSMD